MKFLSEIYPNVKFFKKVNSKEQIFYGVERSKLQKLVHTSNFIFIPYGSEFNTMEWKEENGKSYHDALTLNEFEYVLEKEHVEDLYNELVQNEKDKKALIHANIAIFHQFKQTNHLPKEVHEFVLHYLKEMNHKKILLNDADWEDSFTFHDGNVTNHLVVFNEENGYMHEEEVDYLIQEEASFENSSSSSKLYITTDGKLIQEYHPRSEKDIEHHVIALRVVEGEEKEQYLQLLFKKGE
ncbi:TPA: hypothetical protein QCU60_004320 [Bacillus cereus]|nr:hypothetical protein [Bacillus cereus]HDR6312334.1 hypothetical protein [Bacillus cereus]